jgi:hypothetical protein
MKIVSRIGGLLIAASFVASLEAEDVIKDKSPDGKFALLISGNEYYPEAALIELGTKRKVVDLGPVGFFRHDTKLVWSANSQRVACFNPNHAEHTTTYFRKDSNFEEGALPEIPRCGEAKGQDGKDVELVSLNVSPVRWLESGKLIVTIKGEWKRSQKDSLECDETVTIAFDAQHKGAIEKAQENPKEVGREIESPNGTFFVEELNAPAKDDEGHPRMDQEVWIVSAKDPAARERLPGFYEEEGSGGLNSATISPDEKWIVISKHHGSHLNSTYLMRRKEGLKFENAFPDAKWPLQEDPVNRFDNEVWKFFSKTENVPAKKIDANELGPTPVSLLEWSEDSGRLLLDLHGGLTGDNDIADRGRYEKPGISGWFAYYNTKTGKFELTERLRKANAGARKRWSRSADENAPGDGFVPPSPESIGHEGPDAPVAERLRKYEAELAALVKKRESQLEGVDRAEFQKKEKDWREEVENEAAKIKDPQKRLGFRTRSTCDHLNNVREYWLPVYEPAKVEAEKHPQP